MIFCSRCHKELDEQRIWTTAEVSDTEIVGFHCNSNLQRLGQTTQPINCKTAPNIVSLLESDFD